MSLGTFSEVTTASGEAWTPTWMKSKGQTREALHHQTTQKPSSFKKSDVDLIGEAGGDSNETDFVASARPLSPSRGINARGKRIDASAVADDEEILTLPDGRTAIVKKKITKRANVPKQWVLLTDADKPAESDSTDSMERTTSKYRVNPAHVDIPTPPSVTRADLDAAMENADLREELDTTHHIKRDQWTEYWEVTERYRRMLGKDK